MSATPEEHEAIGDHQRAFEQRLNDILADTSSDVLAKTLSRHLWSKGTFGAKGVDVVALAKDLESVLPLEGSFNTGLT